MKLKKIIRPEMELEVCSPAGWLLIPFYALLVYAKGLRVMKINYTVNLVKHGAQPCGTHKFFCVPKIRVVKQHEN